MSFSEIVDTIEKRVAAEADPAKIKGINAVFQFELTGDGGGIFHAWVADGKVEIIEAQHENPNLTVIMPLDDFEKLMAGQLSAASAFIAGKLKVKGDMSLALKLQHLIGQS
jgi:putative sterol carrier protein